MIAYQGKGRLQRAGLCLGEKELKSGLEIREALAYRPPNNRRSVARYAPLDMRVWWNW
ncbi:MAG TPA: hypothetical protein VF485_09115 [Sphingomonas sp.]